MTTIKTFDMLIEQADEIAYKPNDLTNTNLLIVDGNNLGYRYLKRKNFNSFMEDYTRTVESLANSYKCKDVVVAYDYGKSAYRLNILPEYKGTRAKPETPEDKEHYEKFFEELNRTQREIPFDNFKLYGVEADDIIAFIVQKLKYYYQDVWIISSDRDIYQLLDKQVHIFNLFSRKEINLQYLLDEKQITPDEYRLSRIIQGDAGDNIKGIEGIGEKRGQDLAKTHKTLGNLLTKLPLAGKSQYIRNLNAGKDLLLRNEKLINLLTHTREVITFGENGNQHLEALDNWCNSIIQNNSKIHDVGEVIKPTQEVVNIIGLANTIK